MWIIGCDWHTRYEQIAAKETTTGELMERRVEHEGGQAEKFHAALPQPVRVGLEATGTTQWFERLLARLGHELWVGDAAAIRARSSSAMLLASAMSASQAGDRLPSH
jgi:transposase